MFQSIIKQRYLAALLSTVAIACMYLNLVSQNKDSESLQLPRTRSAARESLTTTSRDANANQGMTQRKTLEKKSGPRGSNTISGDSLNMHSATGGPTDSTIRRFSSTQRLNSKINRSIDFKSTNTSKDSVVPSESDSNITETTSNLSDKPFRLPLFFAIDDNLVVERVPGLTVEGLQVLRQDFEEQAGVGMLPTDSPAYAARWKQAELTLEQRMRVWYGWAAWSAFEHQSALEASANNKPPSTLGN